MCFETTNKDQSDDENVFTKIFNMRQKIWKRNFLSSIEINSKLLNYNSIKKSEIKVGSYSNV